MRIYNSSKHIKLILLLVCTACQGGDSLEETAVRKVNQTAEYITRTQDQKTLIPPMEPLQAIPYSWEHRAAHFPPITKAFFRCKGSSLNLVRSEFLRGEVIKYHDCGGADKHSLPLRNGKEWIYPILVDLLNYIQTQTNKRVVVTSGHRCPEHNAYVDPSPHNQYSKHQIGAEVDFYVQGMESQPERIIALIFQYYQTHPQHRDKKQLTEFKRYEKKDTNVSTPPWMNKEIFIKLYRSNEGRNHDNRHPYPYIAIQVRHDLEKNERVVYSWDQAFRNFLRY